MTHCVRIEAPARLHLGFVDLNGGLGRRFGSIGLAITGLDAAVCAAPSQHLQVEGVDAARATRYAAQALAGLGAKRAVHLTVECAAPAHAGLGSGTQLALAVAAACAEVLGYAASPRSLAQYVGRGQRSGIGLAAFEGGGFLVDGGRGPQTAVPPLLARLTFPAAWRIVLILDRCCDGLSGRDETSAFDALPTMTAEAAGALARLTLVGLLPAVAEADFGGFCRHLAAVQALIGSYFSPAQGGAFTSPRVAEAAQATVDAFGLPGIGQSSWGPTGFVFVPDEARALAVLAALRERYAESTDLAFMMVAACNRGALATSIESRAQRESLSY